MRRIHRLSVWYILLFSVNGTSAAAQSRRPITETDLFNFVWAADPQISPDGSRVLFVRVTANEKKDSYESAVYIVPSNGSAPPRALTSGKSDHSPRWSPNGSEIAFIRTPDTVDGKPKQSQIFLISMSGGEARALTDLPKGASSPRWSPDGRTIAFVSTPAADSAAAKRELRPNQDSTASKRVSDVRIITRAQYRWNGGGYTDQEFHSHIWTVPALSASGPFPTPRQITFGDFDEGDPVWSPDGSRLYFTSDRHFEPYYQSVGSELYTVAANGGQIAKVAGVDGDVGQFALSRDGKQIAFLATANGKPVRSYDQPDLFVTSVSPGSTPRNVTGSYDFDVGGGIGSDQHSPRAGTGPGVIWSADGQSVIVTAAEHGRANLKRISLGDGSISPISRGDQEVISYTVSSDGSRLVALVSTPVDIGDLFIVGLSESSPSSSRITRLNESLFNTLQQSAPEEIWYAGFDGRRIQGWILKPPAFDRSKKYPLILEIHGGPHSAYGSSFMHEFSWMAAKGYVVLYTNPRGSTSYGQDFGNVIQFNYPGDDYKDLMAGVDEVLKRGYVDSTRIGVTGGSGGGVLTNWTITQTNRFAAAVSQRSIADWASFWYTADFTLFTPTWFRAAPWENPQDFAARSAITHIAKVTTPLMLIEGESDLRTPAASGGEMMFRALKYLRKPTVMVRFPGETHELSRSGKPWHRIERLRHIVGWFDTYLGRIPTAAYDVR